MFTLTCSCKPNGPSFLVIMLSLVLENGIASVEPSGNTMFAIHGETIELHCKGFARDKCPHWSYLTPDATAQGDGDFDICECDTEPESGIHCDNSSSGNFILRIRNAGPNNAGRFICKDSVTSAGKILNSTQIIVTSPLRCSSNVELNQTIGPNECSDGPKPDTLSLGCSAIFHGAQNYLGPLIVWKKSGEEANLASRCTHVSNTIRCTHMMNATLDLNGKLFVCSTNDNRHNCQLGPTKVLYAVNGSSTSYKKKAKVGETVTCEANTNCHQCTYKWWRYTKHEDGDEDKVMVSNTSIITFNQPGTYRCEAKCPFRDNTCRVFPTVIIVTEQTIVKTINVSENTSVVNSTVSPVSIWQNTPGKIIGPSSSNVVKVGRILALISTLLTVEILIK